MAYGEINKRVVFYETDKRHADLKIKLHYDRIKQGEFFRFLISGYLEENPEIIKYISECKERHERQSKRQQSVIKKERAEATEIQKKFGLNENEIETIFDILEKETGI